MSRNSEDGYILASAIAVLVIISIVAAALMSTSVDGVRRIQRLERDAAADAVLQSAELLVTSQLSQDPRRRQIEFATNETVIEVLDTEVGVRVSWESAKLDVNLAEPEALQDALAAAGLDMSKRLAVIAVIESTRSQNPIRLLEDVVPEPADLDCLHTVLTVFGGRSDYDPDTITEAAIGRPAAGSRLSIETWLVDQPAKGQASVVIMTGDPQTPAKVLDWRPFRAAGRERCNEPTTP